MLPQQQPRNKSFIRKLMAQDQNRTLSINWLAGLAAGFCSTTLFSPLDLARTRHIILATTNSYGVVQYQGFIQTLYKIYYDEGWRGLYKGFTVTAIAVPLFQSLYFGIFYKTKSYLNQKWFSDKKPIIRDMLASLFTGFVCNTVTNPLWVIRTRIQSQYLHREETIPKYNGLVSGFRKLCQEEGYRSLFKGLLVSYAGLTHCVVFFPLYEWLKTKLASKKSALSNTDILLASNISKLVAVTITYPHIVIRARLQDSRSPIQPFPLRKDHNSHSKPDKHPITITSVIKSTYQKEGLKGFYSGLKIDLIRGLPANSATFVVFEYLKRKLEEMWPCEENI